MTPPAREPHALSAPPLPDPWLAAYGPLLAGAPQGVVLDVACGEGRNTLWAAGLGRQAVGLDVSSKALGRARREALRARLPARFVRWDVERSGLPPGPWAAVLIFHFLARDLLRAVHDAVVPGGVVIAKTHLHHPLRALGARPRRRAFLLGSGELPGLCRGLEPVAYAEWAGRGGAYAAIAARRPWRAYSPSSSS